MLILFSCAFPSFGSALAPVGKTWHILLARWWRLGQAVAYLEPANPAHTPVTEHAHQQNCWTREEELLEMS